MKFQRVLKIKEQNANIRLQCLCLNTISGGQETINVASWSLQSNNEGNKEKKKIKGKKNVNDAKTTLPINYYLSSVAYFFPRQTLLLISSKPLLKNIHGFTRYIWETIIVPAVGTAIYSNFKNKNIKREIRTTRIKVIFIFFLRTGRTKNTIAFNAFYRHWKGKVANITKVLLYSQIQHVMFVHVSVKHLLFTASNPKLFAVKDKASLSGG